LSVLRRPLPVLLGLTVADYVAWRLSDADGPEVLALISGLTLTLLLLALAWMLIVSLVRVLVDRSVLPRRVVVPKGVALGSTARSAIPTAAVASGRRRAAFTVRRMRIRREAPRGPHLPEHASRPPVDAGRASRTERIAA
jgi:hypothetical protein